MLHFATAFASEIYSSRFHPPFRGYKPVFKAEEAISISGRRRSTLGGPTITEKSLTAF